MLNLIAKHDADQLAEDKFFEKKFTLYNDLPQAIRDALADPNVQDVIFNPGGEVLLFTNGRYVSAGTMSAEAAMRFCRKAAKLHGRAFNEEDPFLSAILPDNERLEAVYPSISVDGLTFVLRRPGPLWTLDDLCKKKSMTVAQADIIKNTCGVCNIMVSGWMKSGKTTIVRAICAEHKIKTKDVRRIQIETDTEVQKPENGARFRTSDKYGFNDVFMSVLRLSTELVLFSEVRTSEQICTMVDAVTTGHIGVGTVHARSPLAAASRMYRKAQKVELVVPEDIALACEIVVHVQIAEGGSRKVTEVSKITTDGERFVAEKLA